MQEYLEIIKSAVLFFPFIAFLFTVPYILNQYHKYGSLYYVRVFIVYSFILYLIAAYFLVILPLPKIEDVALLTTPRMQLVPFSFVQDFIRETSFSITSPNTYLKALTEPCFYVVFYNILLTFPFGVYLRYYFHCSKKKTVFLTFLLSLFFELTQLSGLYFIYPRGYRLFDVDDLLLNTFGGFLGVLFAGVLMKFLPSRENLEQKSYELGQKVSFLRRITCFCLDLFLVITMYLFLSILIKRTYLFPLVFFLYYIIIPYLMRGSTIAEKFLNLRLVSTISDKLRFWQVLLYHGSFYLLYFWIPFWAIRDGSYLFTRFSVSSTFVAFFYIGGFLGYSFICVVSLVFTLLKKPLFYEILSKTRLVSTVVQK